MKKNAILLGATGLIGKELLQQLLDNVNYDKIIILVRSATNIENPKLREYIINFETPEEWTHLVQGDELFMAFGTTIKKAGSKENQYKIDVDYQFEVAKAAWQNGVKKVLLVSSAGANSKSNVFYNHLKGRLEDKIRTLKFEQHIIFRPSVLIGERPENRAMEKFAIKTLNFLNSINLAKKHQAIKGSTVAKAMINAANMNNPKNEYILNEIFIAGLGNNYLVERSLKSVVLFIG